MRQVLDTSALQYISILISILIGAGVLWQRISGPTERRLKELEEWKRLTDKKLARDLENISTIQRYTTMRNDFERVMLHGMQMILDHLAKNDDSGEMKKIAGEIDAYLIGLTHFGGSNFREQD